MHNLKGPDVRLPQQPQLLNTRGFCQLCLWLYGLQNATVTVIMKRGTG